MTFEWDPAKSSSNKAKHGLDFEEALALWMDPRGLEVPGHPGAEPRKKLIARLGRRCWVAVHAWRGQTIRIISVRRAHSDEQKAYEAQD